MNRYEFLLPAVAMMLGWGLRGFIGGGPFGAMIPGAMVALCLCLLHKRKDAAIVAAFAAIGVGIGGQMTYGQTVGFIVKADTFWWGFLGLALKGGIWGFVAGGVIAMAFTPRTRLVAGGSAAMALATYAGWKLINEPKLIYFSNREDRPRPEIWAGFLLAGAALLLWLHWRKHLQPALRFALAGFVGGFIGFGFGGAIQGLGRVFTPELNLHWWKYMEFFFGLCFGWALAWAMKTAKLPEPEPSRDDAPALPLELLLAGALSAATFWLTWNVPTRFTYLLVGGAILILLTRVRFLNWHVALTITFTATMLDSAKYWSVDYKRGAAEPAYAVAILCSIAFAIALIKWVRNDTLRGLELITWACVADATFKFGMNPAGLSALIDHVAIGFILMAVAVSFMARRVQAALLFIVTLHAQSWTIALPANAVGPPVPFDGMIAIALANSRIGIYTQAGEPLKELSLDAAPLGPPVIDARRIYAADVWGRAYAFTKDGELVWRHDRETRAGNGYSMPVLAGDLLYLTDTRGTLYALNAKGESKLEVKVTNYRLSTPAVAGSLIYFGGDDERVYCVSTDGRLVWSTHLPGGRFGRAVPLLADLDRDGKSELYITTPFVGPITGLHALDAATGAPKWHFKSELQTYASIALADLDNDGRDEILFGDKNTRLYALDASGKRRWDAQLPGRGIFFAPVITRDAIYQITRDADLNVVDFHGRVTKSIKLAAGGGAGPALAGNQLLTATANKLQAWPVDGAGARWTSWRDNSRSAASSTPPSPRPAPATIDRASGYPGTNTIPGEPLKSIRVTAPNGAVHLVIGSNSFAVLTPGQYSVLVNGGERQILFAIGNDADDRALLQLGQTPLASRVRGDFFAARQQPSIERYDNARARLRAAEKSRNAPFVQQLANPWGESLEAAGKPDAIELRMLGNEYESAGFLLTNPYSEASTFRIEHDHTVLEFRDVQKVRALSTGRLTEDLLPRLAQGELITLQPGEQRKLWLIANSHGLAAGTHTKTIRIGALESTAAPKSVTVTMHVSRARLPQQFTYKQCHWFYPANIAGDQAREAAIADALAHGTNVIPLPPPNHALHDALVQRLKGKVTFLAARPKPEEVKAYAGKMKSLGAGYADWAYYVLDEPGLMGKDAAFDQWVADVKAIKKEDPNARIYANPAGGAKPEMLEPVKHLIDIWQPDRHLVLGDPAAYAKLFGAKTYWHYEAPADQRNLDPLGFYRMKPWVAFQMGMTGGGYWVHSSSPYWFFDRSFATEYGAVYMTPEGPVTTKRWEASRDGAEDFELLWQLRGSKLVDNAVAFVTKDQEHATDISRQVSPFAPDYATWMDFRAKLIAALEAKQ